MSLSVGPPLVRSHEFYVGAAPAELQDRSDGISVQYSALKEGKTDFNGNDLQIRFENVRFSYEKDEVPLRRLSFSVPQGSLYRFGGRIRQQGEIDPCQTAGPTLRCDGRTHYAGGKTCESVLASLNGADLLRRAGAVPVQHQPVGEHPAGKTRRHRRGGAGGGGTGPVREFLERLERGFMPTMAGDGGKGLSGGERRRITGPAILKDAPIVVLDKGPPLLDPENEEKMNAAIAEGSGARLSSSSPTGFSPLWAPTRLVVLDQGKVAGSAATIHLTKDLPPPMENCGEAAEGAAAWRVSVEKRRRRGMISADGNEFCPYPAPYQGADQTGFIFAFEGHAVKGSPSACLSLALSAFLQGNWRDGTAVPRGWQVGTGGLRFCWSPMCQNIADRLQSAAGYMVFADLRMELGRHLPPAHGLFTEGNIGKISSVRPPTWCLLRENCMHDIASMMSYTLAQAILVLWLAF